MSEDGEEPEAATPDEPRVRDALAELIDRRLEARLLQRARVATRVKMPPPPPSLPTHLEPERWGAGFLAVRERELPYELLNDLADRTPQALLRDLFRPEWPINKMVAPNYHELGLDMGGQAAWAALREAHVQAPRPRVTPSPQEFRAELVRRREVVRQPWKPVRSDEQLAARAERYRMGNGQRSGGRNP